MKKLIVTSILAALVTFGTTVMAQNYSDEYLGLPGDNLNLYATMKLFQESETLEGFERNLNDEKSRINNLDLNGDNLIDYISVSDYVDGDVHTIVLRAMLDRNETQDVAVFTVQKFGNGEVNIQLIGDEDLYGKNYIIEPIYDETPNPGYSGNRGNNVNVTVIRTTPYEIAAWPLIRYIYVPNYVVWRSSWYWGYYPDYWNPWRPYYWDYYYGYHYNWYNHYYSHYHHYDHYRYSRYNDFYYHGVRAYSPRVRTNINEGRYSSTYSHPEQRKEGEALYTKVNPGQPRRAESSSVNGQRSRPDSQANRTQTNSRSGNVNSRQSAETGNGRPVNNSNNSNRQVNRSPQGQTNNAGQKPSSTGNTRQETKVGQGQRSNNSTRNTSPAYGRTSTRPQQSQGTEVSRSSRQSAPKATTGRPEQSKATQPARASKQSTPKASPIQSKTRTESKSSSSGEKRESKDSKSGSGRR